MNSIRIKYHDINVRPLYHLFLDKESDRNEWIKNQEINNWFEKHTTKLVNQRVPIPKTYQFFIPKEDDTGDHANLLFMYPSCPSQILEILTEVSDQANKINPDDPGYLNITIV